ncbi:MAG: RNA polymerase sigma factor [Bellilinea sp.]
MTRTVLSIEGIDVMTQPNPRAPGSEDPASDQPAIACLKQGNIAGMAALVQKNQVDAVQTALLIVRDRYLAEDIAQEAFLQVYRKIDQFDNGRPFRPWFLRIVINDSLKAAYRQKRSVPLTEPEDGQFAVEWLIDPGPGPENIVETAEVRESVWQALDKLTPDQRAAVVLRYFLEQDERTMIRELDRPLTTIKWWLYAARQRLRKLLQPVDELESDSQENDHA